MSMLFWDKGFRETISSHVSGWDVNRLHCTLSYLFFDPFVLDRKSTRLNSSHSQISYAVFCLKKKTNKNMSTMPVDLFLRPRGHLHCRRQLMSLYTLATIASERRLHRDLHAQLDDSSRTLRTT